MVIRDSFSDLVSSTESCPDIAVSDCWKEVDWALNDSKFTYSDVCPHGHTSHWYAGKEYNLCHGKLVEGQSVQHVQQTLTLQNITLVSFYPVQVSLFGSFFTHSMQTVSCAPPLTATYLSTFLPDTNTYKTKIWNKYKVLWTVFNSNKQKRGEEKLHRFLKCSFAIVPEQHAKRTTFGGRSFANW